MKSTIAKPTIRNFLDVMEGEIVDHNFSKYNLDTLLGPLVRNRSTGDTERQVQRPLDFKGHENGIHINRDFFSNRYRKERAKPLKTWPSSAEGKPNHKDIIYGYAEKYRSRNDSLTESDLQIAITSFYYDLIKRFRMHSKFFRQHKIVNIPEDMDIEEETKNKLIREGLEPGLPDIQLHYKFSSTSGTSVVDIELKGFGGFLSPAQISYRDQISKYLNHDWRLIQPTHQEDQVPQVLNQYTEIINSHSLYFPHNPSRWICNKGDRPKPTKSNYEKIFE